MYKISREFKVSMGHRLSKHDGNCQHIHGHNYAIIIGIKSYNVNSNGMVMDFSQLKSVVSNYIDEIDHAFMGNVDDLDLIIKMKDAVPNLKTIMVNYEPTAENMARNLYEYVKSRIPVLMDYVTIYETDGCQATYTEE